MKKVLSVIIIFATLFSLTSCKKTYHDVNGNELSEKNVQNVLKAISLVNQKWEETYKDYDKDNFYESERDAKPDGTVDIFHTRIINIKENSEELFKNVESVVEFDIFSDFYASAPYYVNMYHNNCVVFYRDGSSEVRNIFREYINKDTESRYFTQYPFVETVIDLGSEFNTPTRISKADSEKEEYVKKAVKDVKKSYKKRFADTRDTGKKTDGTVEIINTRLFMINSNTSYPYYKEYFDGAKALVEFEIYSDYFGTAPYYTNAKPFMDILIMEDGSIDYCMGMRRIISKTFDADLKDLFSECENFGSAFNETFHF